MSVVESTAASGATRPAPIHVLSVTIITVTGMDTRTDATVRLSIDEKEMVLTCQSNDPNVGPVSALCGCFRQIVPDFTWRDFGIRALAQGEGADGKAHVILEKDNQTFYGQSVSSNIMHATACAIADALDKLRWHAHDVERKKRMREQSRVGGM